MSGQQEVRRGDHHQLGVCSRNCVQEDPDFFAVVENDGEEEGMGRRWFQNGEREWGLGTRGGSGGESDLESIREKNEIDKARTELILGEVAAKEEKKFAADIAMREAAQSFLEDKVRSTGGDGAGGSGISQGEGGDGAGQGGRSQGRCGEVGGGVTGGGAGGYTRRRPSGAGHG